MPVLACVGMSIIIYMLLFYSLRKTENETDKNKVEKGIILDGELTDQCLKCNKPYSSNWRYCPYCGNTRENG
ncbi:double zinc ribbon domain-containing protein [Alkaliphilus transvaalensis]|uniref:double zinc ribbon domain-containing protein n=1 Tax=Alkaliphilus transvaalensis TaxID=114628 RepID=UPI000479195B|nr:zinc ribbon domain-containing protein [Alkaliphilus transvaalensis]